VKEGVLEQMSVANLRVRKRVCARARACVRACGHVCRREFVRVCACVYARAYETRPAALMMAVPSLVSCAAQYNNQGRFYQIQQDDTIEVEVDLESNDGELRFIINGRQMPNGWVVTLNIRLARVLIC
jgi:hypothetical protein